jgi:AcrR family transcriptional regulator
MSADGFPGAPSDWLPGVAVGLTEQPQQARSRRTTGQILEAAEQLLAADGVENLTMAAVSKRAGVSIGAIYGRFEGKSGLLRAVKDRALHQLEAELADRYEAPSSGSRTWSGSWWRRSHRWGGVVFSSPRPKRA